ncbi:MAG: YfhO family protein [Chloroflexi bacterium]|nr:YfhO family protein [Chloroflexota bacterium]
MDTPGYLVLTDTWYPGWQATVDGKPAEVLQANYAFRAVYLAAGEHTVEMVYHPTSVLVGEAVSLTTLTLLVVGLPLTRRKEARA